MVYTLSATGGRAPYAEGKKNCHHTDERRTKDIEDMGSGRTNGTEICATGEGYSLFSRRAFLVRDKQKKRSFPAELQQLAYAVS